MYDFHQVNAEISVEVNFTNNTIIFTSENAEKTSSQSRTEYLDSLNEEDKKELRFCVSLGEADSVQIVWLICV